MAKPKHPQATPEPPAPALPNAATLLDEVQQRCESLRAWQQEAQATLQQREQVVEQREKEADETQKQVELGRTRLELDQDAMKRSRLMFDKERAQLEQSQQAIEAERERIGGERSELNEQRQELLDLRGKLDAEWTSLTRIREAQESLAAALQGERDRVSELKLTGTLSEGEDETPAPPSDDTPDLSLTEAA